MRFHFGSTMREYNTLPYQFSAAHVAQQGLWNVMIDNLLLNELTTATATNKHTH